MLHFYHNAMSPYSKKVFFLLEESKKPYDLQVVALERGEHKKAHYLLINPAGRVPAIKDGDLVVTESNAILRYLTRKLALNQIYPAPLTDQAEVDMMWEFCSHHINKPLLDLMWNKHWARKFGREPQGQVIDAAEKYLKRDLPVLESHLLGRHYLCGPDLTLADINLMPFAQLAKDVISLQNYPAFSAWVELVSARQSWRNVVAYSG